jgi:hypothetical protein
MLSETGRLPLEVTAMRIGFAALVGLSALWFRQVDALSRAKDDALASREVGRDCPQPQRHIERIKAQSRPEGQLTDPMLFRVAGGA